MRVTSKGQVTIPQELCEKFGITPAVEIDFIEEKNRIYLVTGKGLDLALLTRDVSGFQTYFPTVKLLSPS
jgi:AbrB family looped-hinge helix DNA binding protein